MFDIKPLEELYQTILETQSVTEEELKSLEKLIKELKSLEYSLKETREEFNDSSFSVLNKITDIYKKLDKISGEFLTADKKLKNSLNDIIMAFKTDLSDLSYKISNFSQDVTYTNKKLAESFNDTKKQISKSSDDIKGEIKAIENFIDKETDKITNKLYELKQAQINTIKKSYKTLGYGIGIGMLVGGLVIGILIGFGGWWGLYKSLFKNKGILIDTTRQEMIIDWNKANGECLNKKCSIIKIPLINP
jgi:DNA repair exonuclease SbcCD ATPase subunit